MQQAKILTTHLHRGITKNDIAFYKAVSALGELYVAIPDDESYQALWQKYPAAGYALEQRRSALETIEHIAIVFDVQFEEGTLEKVCREAFLPIGIHAWACKAYPFSTSDCHPLIPRITQFMTQQGIPILSVDMDAL